MSFAELVENANRAALGHLGGVSVLYQPASGSAVEVTGIFDENFVLVDASQPGVEEVGPAVWLQLADLPVHPEDDEPIITVNSTAYTVHMRRTDGAQGGSILLMLHRAVI